MPTGTGLPPPPRRHAAPPVLALHLLQRLVMAKGSIPNSAAAAKATLASEPTTEPKRPTCTLPDEIATKARWSGQSDMRVPFRRRRNLAVQPIVMPLVLCETPPCRHGMETASAAVTATMTGRMATHDPPVCHRHHADATAPTARQRMQQRAAEGASLAQCTVVALMLRCTTTCRLAVVAVAVCRRRGVPTRTTVYMNVIINTVTTITTASNSNSNSTTGSSTTSTSNHDDGSRLRLPTADNRRLPVGSSTTPSSASPPQPSTPPRVVETATSALHMGSMCP